MSKDFEQAYREFAQTEVPDLWDRIEAGLTEKSAPETVKPKRGKNAVLVFMRKYSAVAAALVCVAILVPAISLVGRFGMGSSKSESAAEAPAALYAGAAEEMPMEEAAMDEAGIMNEAEAPQEADSMEAALAEETEMMSESAESARTEKDDFKENMTMTEKASVEEKLQNSFTDLQNKGAEKKEKQTTDAQEEAKKTEAKEAEVRTETAVEEAPAEEAPAEEAVRPLTERCPENTLLRGVRVKVLQSKWQEDGLTGSGENNPGMVYYVSVQNSPNDLLTENEEIAIFISSYSSVALMRDATYELDLSSFLADGECYFEIVKYRQQITP